MAQSLLELIFRTSKQGQGGKQAAAELKQLKGTIGELTSGLTGFNLAGVTAVGAVVAMGNFVKNSVSEWSAYAEQVGKSADAAGVSAEEMSRLMQAADDARVPIESLQAAMVTALKNGFEPSVDNLADLADELQGITSPADRAAKLSKIFGKNWAEIYPLLKDGGQAIRDGTAAIDDSLVVTDEAIQANREWIKATDDLGDAWQGFQNQIGREALPILTDLLESLTLVSAAAAKMGDEVNKANNPLAAGALAVYEEQLRQAGKELLQLSSSHDVGAGFAAGFAESIAETASVINESYIPTLEELKSMMSGSFRDEQMKFAEKQRNIKNEVAETKAKIQELEGQPYLSEEQRADLEALHSNLTNLQNELASTAQAHEEAMHKMAFNMLLERAASDGMTENELKNLTSIGVQWGLLDLKTAEVIGAINKNMGLLDTENPALLRDILNEILGLPSAKEINVKVHVDGLNDLERMNALLGEPGPVGQPAIPAPPNGGEEVIGGKRANAGSFIVPPGFPNDSYPAWFSSGEKVMVENERMRSLGITPAGAASNEVHLHFGDVIIKNDMDFRSFTERLRSWFKRAGYDVSGMRG